ncbi:MAG: hypothetical protein A4E53_00396 [Pelotomaculum sp. PtaB.Bin104]|nr:MAG: hypothetical protein A4E53_00396 [Pelotomaculum sp. PtaB.Bin104]
MARITKAKQLTDRDKGILTDLGRCRVLSSSQIKNAYWPEAKERTCLERLERLQKAGFVKEQTIYAEKAGQWMKVFCLDEKGRRFVTGPEGTGLDRRTVFIHPGKFDEILHQVRTNEVYYQLSESEQLTYKIGDVIEIERETYRGGGAGVPDASYISDEGEEVYVETDCGSYTGKQVREKVRSFKGKDTVWVCPAGREGFLANHGAKGEFFTYLTSGQGRVG